MLASDAGTWDYAGTFRRTGPIHSGKVLQTNSNDRIEIYDLVVRTIEEVLRCNQDQPRPSEIPRYKPLPFLVSFRYGNNVTLGERGL